MSDRDGPLVNLSTGTETVDGEKPADIGRPARSRTVSSCHRRRDHAQGCDRRDPDRIAVRRHSGMAETGGGHVMLATGPASCLTPKLASGCSCAVETARAFAAEARLISAGRRAKREGSRRGRAGPRDSPGSAPDAAAVPADARRRTRDEA
jgi:hypothetical protein